MKLPPVPAHTYNTKSTYLLLYAHILFWIPYQTTTLHSRLVWAFIHGSIRRIWYTHLLHICSHCPLLNTSVWRWICLTSGPPGTTASWFGGLPLWTLMINMTHESGLVPRYQVKAIPLNTQYRRHTGDCFDQDGHCEKTQLFGLVMFRICGCRYDDDVPPSCGPLNVSLRSIELVRLKGLTTTIRARLFPFTSSHLMHGPIIL